MEGIDPKNLSAQLAYQGRGNPPSTHPRSAISNAFPGLEMDFRNVWRHLFIGIELHEASNLVVRVADDAPDEVQLLANDYRLLSVDGEPVVTNVRGPLVPGGPSVDLPDAVFNDSLMPLEWSNALANVLRKAGTPLRCVFGPVAGGDKKIDVMLTVRRFFDHDVFDNKIVNQRAVIAREIAHPGELSQSLCSPWQNDYRECACFYWAASRPDYVNVEPNDQGASAGHNWMQKQRSVETPKTYLADDRHDPRLVSYDDLFQKWEQELRFIRKGKDEDYHY
jgi:hypothetical protein